MASQTPTQPTTIYANFLGCQKWGYTESNYCPRVLKFLLEKKAHTEPFILKPSSKK